MHVITKKCVARKDGYSNLDPSTKKNFGSTSATDLVMVLLFLNSNNIIMHKRMLPNKAIILNV